MERLVSPLAFLVALRGLESPLLLSTLIYKVHLAVSEELQLVVTPVSLFVACGISILTIFISTYIPAQKASKVSAIDAIRQTQDIKLSGKSVKTSKLVRKIFGMEVEIGLKNVKRNKKRYLATVFSLVISIVLFLSVSYFTDNIKKSLAMSQNDLQFDIHISSSELNREDLIPYTQLNHVSKSTIIEEAQFEALIGMDELPAQLKTQIEENNDTLEDGKYPYYVTLHAIDQESFQEYAKQVGVDAEDFAVQDTPTAIVIDQISYEAYTPEKKMIETKSIQSEVGNKIDLLTSTSGDMENEHHNRKVVSSVVIGALTDQIPVGIQTSSLGGLNLIVPEETMDHLGIAQDAVTSYVYLNSTDPLATQTAIEAQNDMNVHVYNVYQQRQQEEQMILLMSVFTYGFIILISFISIANIFNTISTSISMRKREFAMLRSVGMTPKGFNKMIHYESIFYGVKALVYGLPSSILVMLAIHRSTSYTFEFGFNLPWMSILFVIVMIFLIVGTAMLYSISKIKNENIIESLKQENI